MKAYFSNVFRSRPNTTNFFVLGKFVGVLVIVLIIFVVLGFLFPANMLPKQGQSDRYCNLLNSKIRYRVVNRGGTAIILLHSFGGDLDMWNSVIKHMSCGRIFSLDLVGFGLSDRPRITYSLETQRRYLLAFMDAMNIDSALLVGSSMGASIAAWTAGESPERVKAVVLFAPSGYPGSMCHRWPVRIFYRPGIFNRLGRIIAGTLLFEKMFPSSLVRQALDITASYNDSFVDAVKKIFQPTLLVWSRGDKRVPFSYSTVYIEKIPHARFIELPIIAGHEVATFDPEFTASHICEMLKKVVQKTTL